jgi:hypothetical protein
MVLNGESENMSVLTSAMGFGITRSSKEWFGGTLGKYHNKHFHLP